jgi:hypothetical protein
LKQPSCGDYVVNPGEDCDDGPDGSVTCGTDCLTRQGSSVEGDPHFKTWRGKRYDYHGECDLVLFESSKFMQGLGAAVHVRTKMQRDMSYVSNAALKIGEDVFEVASKGIHHLNGVEGVVGEISGFAITHTQPNDHQHVFNVNLGEGERILIKTYKDFVSVMVDGAEHKHFGDSVGLMGAFEKGRMLARDGKTELNAPNAFGQEWQVRDTEPKLFQTNRFPQYPQVCTMPAPNQMSSLRRRLSESSVEQLAAEKACAHWGEEGKDDCVFDVLTTGDLEMAIAGAY